MVQLNLCAAPRFVKGTSVRLPLCSLLAVGAREFALFDQATKL